MSESDEILAGNNYFLCNKNDIDNGKSKMMK